jgi:hypothetical protein
VPSTAHPSWLAQRQGLGKEVAATARLRYEMTDYWTDEELKIDDKIFLEWSRPHFGGRRWWFVCPRRNQPVRKLCLPLGGRHFWSRRGYRLGYASQRESWHDRAYRRVRKLSLRLGGDPADDSYPDKPNPMVSFVQGGNS